MGTAVGIVAQYRGARQGRPANRPISPGRGHARRWLSSWRWLFVAFLGTVCANAARAAAPTGATEQVISCLKLPASVHQRGEPAAGVAGPCTRPESVAVIPGAFPDDPPALLTNFGLLLCRPDASGFDLLCEETFGGRVSKQIERGALGALLIPGLDGVYRSGVTCGFAAATGSVFGAGEIVDLAPAPDDPATVLALSLLPPILHRSRDGGQSFEAAFAFEPGFRPQRIFVAPANPQVVVVAGYDAFSPFVLARSVDGGLSFAIGRGDPAMFGRPGTVTELLGLDPTRPMGDRLFVAAGSPDASDVILVSEDAGTSFAPVLALRGFEVKAGFAISSDGQTVYVAGRAVFDRPSEPPAHLYRSDDGGRSFPDILASGAAGPHYACLALAGPRLHACGDEPKDGFLFAASPDQGRTWGERVRLADMVGPPACAGNVCLATAQWLCEAYDVCSPGLSRDAGAFPDATPAEPDGTLKGDGSCADGAPCPASTKGCGCRSVAGPARPSGVVALGFLLLAWAGRRRLGPRRRPHPAPLEEKVR